MKRFLGRGHGILRGLEGTGSSTLLQGRFGRMFRTLPPAKFSDHSLNALALKMVAPPEDKQTPEDQIDDEENPGISAGYTYLGQFIDHDLTFDPNSSLQKRNDPDALVDYRTPRFDLDNLYGRGPDDQPYLYDDDGIRMLLGRPVTGNPGDPKARDVQRNDPPGGPRRALIGDPRNDENVIVSQLQAAMLRFHNRVVEVTNATRADLERVQRLVRWHYQWVVLHDFLPTILGKQTVDAILPSLAKGTSVADEPPVLKLYRWKVEPFIPVEFSVGAYRFGHSMVRPIYRLNKTLADRQMIFSADPKIPNLVGFAEPPPGFGIDWSLFFKMAPNPPDRGVNRLQQAYKIDSSIVNPLGALPASVASQFPSLALRNLLRGNAMGLPSGQSVARRLGVKPLGEDLLKVGKANQDGHDHNPTLASISHEFKGHAPLWYYVLAEAQQQWVDKSSAIHLGEVGGRIVGEVFVGLMVGDPTSYLSQHPCFEPLPEFRAADGTFGMAELLKQSLLA